MRQLFESLFDEPLGKGERAKAAILQAAAVEFGERGLDGARTREIAKRSGQNLGAIHYYFGNKEQLYHALARFAVAFAQRRMGPVLATAQAACDDASTTRLELRERIWQLLLGVVEMIVVREETVPISLIIVREQTCPTEAFDIFYDGLLNPLHTTLTRLVARCLEQEASSPAVICRAHALLGQVIVFRAGRATICRRAGWETLDIETSETVRDAIRANLEAMLPFDERKP